MLAVLPLVIFRKALARRVQSSDDPAPALKPQGAGSGRDPQIDAQSLNFTGTGWGFGWCGWGDEGC